MRVTVEIPDRIGWALTDRAEARGMNLGDLIGRMVVRAWTPTPDGRAPTMRDRVEREWSKGAPDAVIAHRLGEPLESVRVARRSLKLTPHKFRREQWAHELNPTQPPASSGVSSTQQEEAAA